MGTLSFNGGPKWLRDFACTASFFQSCPKCSSEGHGNRDTVRNFYCLETGQELCSVCVADRSSGTIIQVRRSSYHDVVRAQDIAKLADVSGIQSYTINGARVLFLRRRPQPRPPKGAVGASQCTICSRHLQDVSLYCSLQCKLDALAGSAQASLSCEATDSGACIDVAPAAGAPPAKVPPASSDSSSDSHPGPQTPSHLHALRPLDDSSSSDSDSVMEDAFCHSRRKGSPQRSFLE